MGNANETMTPPPSPEVTTKKLKLMDLQVRLEKFPMYPYNTWGWRGIIYY